tara:strand:- start:114 stop:392 length:279 start_codon:yes stop_codon:yes gene_type:complete
MTDNSHHRIKPLSKCSLPSKECANFTIASRLPFATYDAALKKHLETLLTYQKSKSCILLSKNKLRKHTVPSDKPSEISPTSETTLACPMLLL